jgi:copper transport protein
LGPIVAWAVVMAALVATWSLAGHASVGRYVVLSVASDVIHLMAAGVWVGGLCLLAWTALRERDFGRAWDAVRVFSPIALTCVAVIIVTGSFQTWRDTGHWAALVHTTYGLLILAKIAGLLMLMGLGYAARGAIANFLVERSSVAQAGDATARALRRLRGGVAFEVLVAVAVLGLTAVLVNTATGSEAYTPVASTSQTFDTGTVRGSVTIVVKPATLGPQTVDIAVTDSHQRPYQPAEVEASLTLPERSIGPLPLHVSSEGGGRYHTAPAPVGIAGAWIVSVTIRSDDFDETTVTGDATVR